MNLFSDFFLFHNILDVHLSLSFSLHETVTGYTLSSPPPNFHNCSLLEPEYNIRYMLSSHEMHFNISLFVSLQFLIFLKALKGPTILSYRKVILPPQ